MKFSKYKNKPSHEDDLDEKIDRFNKKAYWDYLIPFFRKPNYYTANTCST